ncbi:MAG: lamin tail domain-containing protein, partial [Anaerolineae bacterium]|nr:lamin tail domain-containing protein [Anaerolineae bacterium]
EAYDDGDNARTCQHLNALAAQESVSLTCRLANVTGLGIHAKLVLVQVAGEAWVHLGSLNGTENSHKNNREVALQFNSPEAYGRFAAVFDHDWAEGHGPYIYHAILPLVAHDYTPPADYPLLSEVFVNPSGEDAGREWIEVYNPGLTRDLSGWTLGDTIRGGDYGDGRYRFPAGAVLLEGQAVVVAACGTDFAAAYGFLPAYEWNGCRADVPDLLPDGNWEGFGLALGNTQDEVLLRDAGGALVDSVAWGGAERAGVAPYPLAVGEVFPYAASLRRYPPDVDTGDCGVDFYVSYSPSPGRP